MQSLSYYFLLPVQFAAYPWRVLPANVVAACKGSLDRLGVDQISLGQLHWSASNYAPLQELALWNGLADCYDQGLIKAAGMVVGMQLAMYKRTS